jgi:hypothetical protein
VSVVGTWNENQIKGNPVRTLEVDYQKKGHKDFPI